jgi:predicted SAM-dependent methyltransferase
LNFSFNKDNSGQVPAFGGGSGSGAFDHKILYTYRSLANVFLQCGYSVDILECFDENRVFLAKAWQTSDGFVHRSKNHDTRNTKGSLNYTSIIIDAIKPL